MKKKKMLVFTCTDFDSYFPVGVAAVIFAQNKIEVRGLLDAALIQDGLNPKVIPLYKLHLRGQEKVRAIILNNGDYYNGDY